jgi:hypothetical protein
LGGGEPGGLACRDQLLAGPGRRAADPHLSMANRDGHERSRPVVGQRPPRPRFAEPERLSVVAQDVALQGVEAPTALTEDDVRAWGTITLVPQGVAVALVIYGLGKPFKKWSNQASSQVSFAFRLSYFDKLCTSVG